MSRTPDRPPPLTNSSGNGGIHRSARVSRVSCTRTALVPASVLGPYQIVAAIGAGGMGEVYRARDKRLNREVAIKVLPPLFAGDSDDARGSSGKRRRSSRTLSHP